MSITILHQDTSISICLYLRHNDIYLKVLWKETNKKDLIHFYYHYKNTIKNPDDSYTFAEELVESVALNSCPGNNNTLKLLSMSSITRIISFIIQNQSVDYVLGVLHA